MLSHPLQFFRTMIPFGWARKTAILLVMQPVDSHLRYTLRRRWYWPFGKKLDSDRGGGPPVLVYFPVASGERGDLDRAERKLAMDPRTPGIPPRVDR